MSPRRPHRPPRRWTAAVSVGAVLAAVTWLVLGGPGGTGEDTVAGEPTASPPTRASRAPTGPRALVWAVGDGDSGRAAAALARLIRRSDPDRFIYLGDVYERGTRREFERNYAPTYGRLADGRSPRPAITSGPEPGMATSPTGARRRDGGCRATTRCGSSAGRSWR